MNIAGSVISREDAAWLLLALGRKTGMTIETVRRVMMVLLVLVVGGLLVYGAFMLAEIASSVSH